MRLHRRHRRQQRDAPGHDHLSRARARAARPGDGARRCAAGGMSDRPHDAEALFVLPDGGLFIVTKEDPVALYRVPGPFRAGATVRFERVAVLASRGTSGGAGRRAHVTGADASPDGRWVALRTNAAVMFYNAREFVAGQIREVLHYDVTAQHEPQGEGVAFGAANDIWLAGEGGGTFGTLARVECTLK